METAFTRRAILAALAPAPSDAACEVEAAKDRIANPHNDPRRSARRSQSEIEFTLRLRWADGLLVAAAIREATDA